MENFQDNIAAILASKFVNSTNNHIFLTGKAGTGKTTFLKTLVKNCHKKAVITAPTGIAALNAGGVTLHSMFQLPFGAFFPSNQFVFDNDINFQFSTPQSLFQNYHIHNVKRDLIREIELLIIDEVSMLRADLLDAIDLILRHIRRQKHLSFGGLQVLFIGDLLQLPPVVRDNEWNYLKRYYQGVHFFNSQALKQNPPVYIELEKVYRQSDNSFINILNNLRENKITQNDIETLNKYYKHNFNAQNEDGYVYLTTHNYKADKINKEALAKINCPEFDYEAEIKGEFNEYNYPVDPVLRLKEGAQVMFIKNDPSGEQKFFNGKIGIVSKLTDDNIEVKFTDGSDVVDVEKYTWENKKYSLNAETNEIEENVAGSFIHYPLKAAWAITVHKSQGLTFKKAVIDVADAFASGQVYVALSRLISLDGLVLTSKLGFDGISIDHSIFDFASTKKNETTLNQELNIASKSFVSNYVLSAFDFNKIISHLEYHIDSYDKDESKSVKQKHIGWAKKLKTDFLPHIEVSNKFLQQLNRIISNESDNYIEKLFERTKAARQYFEPHFREFSKNIVTHKSNLVSTKGVKKYITELQSLELQFSGQLQRIIKAQNMLDAVIKNEDFTSENIKAGMPVLHKETIVTRKDDKLKHPDNQKNNVTISLEKPKLQNTKEISYNLLKEGKTIDEIAKIRNFTSATIEGHLLYYVAQGQLDANDFVDKEKITDIIQASEKLSTYNLTPIKELLGENYSYSELKFALASINKYKQK